MKVEAGEEGLAREGEALSVAPVLDLAGAMSWTELGPVDHSALEEGDVLGGLGSLRARRPGEREEQERPMTLARHSVRVRIVGNVAHTEIEEVFRNDSEQTLEGIYRFPLPPDAQIARLALDVDGTMEEGAFVGRERAQQIWRGVIRNATPRRQRVDREEFIWVPGPWRDPALLEWQQGGQFQLRIFPIPARGERRVILAYTQRVQPQGNQRRYVYPLAHAEDGSTAAERFDLDVRVAGAERVLAHNYRVTSTAEQDGTRMTLAEDRFVPKGDLIIDYALPGGERELRYWTYRGEAAVPPPEDTRERDRDVTREQQALADDDRPYVAFALRPNLPAAEQRRPRDLAFVVDSSQSMVGERFTRARRLVERVVSEMDRRDRFTVFACDVTCAELDAGLRSPSAQDAAAIRAWLETVEPGGSTNVVEAVRHAAGRVLRDPERDLHVMYVGDGVSSVGYRRPASVAAEVEALLREQPVTVSAVGIGGDADTVALETVARAGGGHYVPYVPGQRVFGAAMAVLESTYGASLREPRVDLPAGLEAVAPARLGTLRAGQEVVVVARMTQPRVEGAVRLTGTVAGEPFEGSYPVELVPTDAAGNRFVPRLWAAATLAGLQAKDRPDDRAKVIALSRAFGVMSRHTSLLVLESPAMFRAFGVDRAESRPDWTGEEDVVGGAAGGVITDLGTRGARGRDALPGIGPIPQAQPRARALNSPFSGDLVEGWSDSASGGAGRATERLPQREVDDRMDEDLVVADEARLRARRSTRPRLPPRGRGGQWMRRVRERVARLDRRTQASTTDLDRVREAESALRENPDSRDRQRDLYRALSRAGELDRALEVVEAWIVRDRQDPEALVAKSDLLGRMGRRDEALRALAGAADVDPDAEWIHRWLAIAHEQLGRTKPACAHWVALAEADGPDTRHVAEAIACERAAQRSSAADRLIAANEAIQGWAVLPGVTSGVRRIDERVPRPRYGGDFRIDARWEGDTDVDVSIIDPRGNRLSLLGGRRNLAIEQLGQNQERLALRWAGAGTYRIEVSRTDPDDRTPVEGRLRIQVLDELETIPFTLREERETVARVRVRWETRTVPVRR